MILRATAQKPDERHHSVAEFLADVERVIRAGDITGWEPLEETAQRHLQRLRFQSTTIDELDEFLDWALAMNPQDFEEAQTLTSVLPALTNGAITDL